MPTLSETELLARDAQRDLNAELLEAVAQLRQGQVGRVSQVAQDGQIIEVLAHSPPAPLPSVPATV